MLCISCYAINYSSHYLHLWGNDLSIISAIILVCLLATKTPDEDLEYQDISHAKMRMLPIFCLQQWPQWKTRMLPIFCLQQWPQWKMRICFFYDILFRPMKTWWSSLFTFTWMKHLYYAFVFVLATNLNHATSALYTYASLDFINMEFFCCW
jgi:hypothetical protein